MQGSRHIRAGQLRKVVDIESPPTGQTSSGDPNTNWGTFLSQVHASIEPLSGRELIAAAAVQNAGTHLVTMRYRQGVTAKMRVKYSTLSGIRYFNIISPPRNIEERGHKMEFEVQEGLKNG